jgi:hypothetical protein
MSFVLTGEDRLTAIDIGRRAGGDNEELARFGGIRIPEDRRCDIALAMTCMLCRWVRCGGGAYCAHGKMNGAAP